MHPSPIIGLHGRTRSKLFFFILTFSILFVFINNRHANAAPVALDTAQAVTSNFLSYLNTSHTVKHIESVDSSDHHVGYLVHLLPQGYILIAGDDIRVPVKAYSLSSNFNGLPVAYTNMLLHELEIVATQLSKSSTPPETTNSTYW